jgi:ATP-dependent DNA helicase DinG
MLLKLKQGTGRLIRRHTDRGVIAILDPRAVTRERYAELVAETLPAAPRVGSLEEAAAFLATAGVTTERA